MFKAGRVVETTFFKLGYGPKLPKSGTVNRLPKLNCYLGFCLKNRNGTYTYISIPRYYLYVHLYMEINRIKLASNIQQ